MRPIILGFHAVMASTIFAPWAEASSPLAVVPASTVYHKPLGGGAGGTAGSTHNAVSVRRLSVLSGVVHRKIKGVGFVLDLSSGAGLVGRITNVRNLDVLHAMKCIGEAGRRAAQGSDAAGAEAPPLEACLAGWAAFCDAVYKPVIPLPLSPKAYPNLYHDQKICALTGRCWLPECPEREKAGGGGGGRPA